MRLSPNQRKLLAAALVPPLLFLVAGLCFGHTLAAQWGWPLLATLAYLALLEGAFRLGYRLQTGRAYRLVPKVPFEKISVEPHPYLPFVLKKNARGVMTGLLPYPLNRDKGYRFDAINTNELGLCNGEDGSREVTLPKPPGRIRVCCLGASTTQNYLVHEGRATSYPLELERELRQRFPGRDLEVVNCGVGGYTSAEILIQFALTVVDLEPDFVVLYHGNNDLAASLTADFQSDYSHAKRSFAETCEDYRRASRLPWLPLAFYNFCLFRELPFAILESVSRGHVDIGREFKEFRTFTRNLEHLIHMCRARGVPMILSTFCHHLYTAVRNDPAHLKAHEGIFKENRILQTLAERYGLPLVDNARNMPADDAYFVDSIHFSPLGMRALAQNLSGPIIEALSEKRRPVGMR